MRKGNGRKCAYPGCCTSDKNRGNLVLFTFPTDATRFIEWVEACKAAAKILSLDIDLKKLHQKKSFICGLHFTEHMFSNYDKSRLLSHAKPIITVAENGTLELMNSPSLRKDELLIQPGYLVIGTSKSEKEASTQQLIVEPNRSNNVIKIIDNTNASVDTNKQFVSENSSSRKPNCVFFTKYDKAPQLHQSTSIASVVEDTFVEDVIGPEIIVEQEIVIADEECTENTEKGNIIQREHAHLSNTESQKYEDLNPKSHNFEYYNCENFQHPKRNHDPESRNCETLQNSKNNQNSKKTKNNNVVKKNESQSSEVFLNDKNEDAITNDTTSKQYKKVTENEFIRFNFDETNNERNTCQNNEIGALKESAPDTNHSRSEKKKAEAPVQSVLLKRSHNKKFKQPLRQLVNGKAADSFCKYRKIAVNEKHSPCIAIPEINGSLMSWMSIQQPIAPSCEPNRVPICKLTNQPVTKDSMVLNNAIVKMKIKELNHKIETLRERVQNKRRIAEKFSQRSRRYKKKMDKAVSENQEIKEKLKSFEKERVQLEGLTELAKSIINLPHGAGKHPYFIPQDVKEFALNIYSLSREVYIVLREVFPALPHPQTIYRWFQNKVNAARDRIENSNCKDLIEKVLMDQEEIGNSMNGLHEGGEEEHQAVIENAELQCQGRVEELFQDEGETVVVHHFGGDGILQIIMDE